MKMAIQCCRSILMVTPKTACDQEIVRYMIPRLITFATTTNEDPENAKGLVCHILASFVSTLFGDQVQIAMAIFIPTFLSRAASNPRSYHETATRLLELVAVNQVAFKNVVANLNPSQRAFMEEILLSKARMAEGAARPESNVPTIALKMNFGA